MSNLDIEDMPSSVLRGLHFFFIFYCTLSIWITERKMRVLCISPDFLSIYLWSDKNISATTDISKQQHTVTIHAHHYSWNDKPLIPVEGFNHPHIFFS